MLKYPILLSILIFLNYKAISQQAKTIQFTPPKVVKDKEVIKPPLEVRQIEESKVDVKTQEGTKDMGVVAPPTEKKGTAVVAFPSPKAEDEVTRVEIEASFPGGEAGWSRYVKKAIEANMDALTKAGESGTCRLRFLVDKEGAVSDVEALTMKGSKLAEIAVNAISKGPHWTPAQQSGRYVKAFTEVQISFSIAEH